MHELTANEVNSVSGGVIAITGIAEGLEAFGVGSALVGAFSAGYWVGTQINNMFGDEISGVIADVAG